jgi:hypothetical protein
MNTQSNNQRLGRFLMVILGEIFLVTGGGLLVGYFTSENMAGPIILFVFALVSSSPLFWSRKNWWALIPTGMFLGGGAAATLDIFSPSNGAAGPAYLFLQGGSFLAFVLLSRKNWWALIPTGLFLGGGVAATLDVLSPLGRATGPAYLFLLGGSFLAIVLLSHKNWWALIPGGFFASLGVVATLENYIPHTNHATLHITPALGVYFTNLDHSYVLGVYFWVLLLGMAATFGVLWLMRKTQSTGWAIYPAVGLLAVALLAFLLGSFFEEAWLASICLVAGIMLLMKVFSKGKPASSQQSTETVK